MNADEFKAKLEGTIDAKFAEIIANKDENSRFLDFVDGKTLTTAVRNIFKNRLKSTPPQIEAACLLSEAVLAPSVRERQQLVRAAIAIGGGTAGIAMIIVGIGAALGWGSGVVASVIAWFVGISMTGPIAWIAGGAAVAAIAGYLSITNNPQKNTERFIRVLKNSTAKGVDAIWDQYEEELSG